MKHIISLRCGANLIVDSAIKYYALLTAIQCSTDNAINPIIKSILNQIKYIKIANLIHHS